MSIHVRNMELSTLHVAKSRDLYFEGGYLERRDGKVLSWPWLHMHVRFGSIEGAVWANRDRTRFLLVRLEKISEKITRVSELSSNELKAFVAKEGVFWTLANKD